MSADKPALRAAFKERRAGLFRAQPLAALTLAARLPRLDPGPAVVAGYWPMRSEIDPRPLMTRFARAGWRIALPVTPPPGTEQALVFRIWREGGEFNTHSFGMREPPTTQRKVRPKLILVPLLAFDARGHRLGYGAGHYDRTLCALRAQGPVRAIGLAFADQETALLPSLPHDQPLDAVLTEREFRPFEPRRGPRP